MRPFTSTIDFDEALRRVLAAALPIDRTERLPILNADSRVIARDISATVDVPAFDRAAMDGYAVIAEDTSRATPASPVTLACIGRVFTGELSERSLTPGTCIEVATGAPMPDRANAVVMVESTEREGDTVRILAGVTAGQHIGKRGADIRTGQLVLHRGDVLTPARLGALTAVGSTSVEVFARPTVAVIPTGNEVIAPGEALAPGQVYDINRFTVSALVQRHGGVATGFSPTADTLGDLATALDTVASHDVVVFSGGSSVGEHDLVLDAVAAKGEIIFHGVAVRPGKPTLFGRIGGTLVFGMPGYPASCLSNAYMLLVPLVRALARLPPWTPRSIDLPLSRRVVSVAGRRQFYTVRVANGRAEPAFKASGDITSMGAADGYIDIPADTVLLETGTVVSVKFF